MLTITNKLIHIFKRIMVNLGNCGNNVVSQSCASIKCTRTDFCYVVRNVQVSKTLASCKCLDVNRLDTFGNVYTFQMCAAFKCT